jgi:ethanolamine utilization protein EutQ (cupin superfamily)
MDIPGPSPYLCLGQSIIDPDTGEPTLSDTDILVEHRPSPAKLDVLGVEGWPIWRRGPGTFPWSYAQTETCYILRGRFTVTPEGGEPMELGRGDLIRFPVGLSCTWEILEAVEKHYRFD